MLTQEQINQIRAKSNLPQTTNTQNYVGKYDYLNQDNKQYIKEKSIGRKIGDFFTNNSQDAVGDIKQFGGKLSETYKKTTGNIQNIAGAELAGEQGKGRSFLQGVGAVAGGVSSGIGDIFTTAIKLALPQRGEEMLKSTVENTIKKAYPTAVKIDEALGRPVGSTVDSYNSMDAKSKRDVDALFGGSMLAFDLGTLGFGKKAGEKVIEKGVDVGIDVAKKTANLTEDVIGKSKRLVSKVTEQGQEFVGEAAYKRMLKTSKDLVKMSPTASKNEAKWAKNTPEFIANEFVLDEKGKPTSILQLIDSDGKRIVNDNAIGTLKDKYYQESASFEKLLADSGEYVSLNKLKTNTISNIETFKNKGTDYEAAIKQINQEIDAYKNNFKTNGLAQGDDLLIRVDDFNKIKSGLWSKTSNFNPTMGDKLLSDVNYRMGQTAKDLIEETVQDVAVKKMNQRLGDFASAIKALENANGKVLPGGFFGKQFTRIAGTIAGTAGGLPGSIIGNITGGVLADIMVNPKIKVGIWTKLYQNLGKTQKGQSIIDDAIKILEKRNQTRAATKLLEAPKYIPLRDKADTSRLFTQEEANILLESLKKKEAQKLLKAPLGDKTNPIILK